MPVGLAADFTGVIASVMAVNLLLTPADTTQLDTTSLNVTEHVVEADVESETVAPDPEPATPADLGAR